ncbi:primosomal protein DnaI [Chengkuizengella axinellae]|uniref:Primosomal protein DnaI n=1 Tax=Chengkuizengella axinellae TaxID=3064388 RepID=A0ABT9ITB8_9BACL|nr:primosomal protein DnaI [Chengkuizengella sp. 2205SS18-9]MDP5272585.1 primosomal protein DnaI [Chengkuizengella sp. 2205SS18-9]
MQSLSEIVNVIPKSRAQEAKDKMQTLLNDPLILKFKEKHPELSEEDLKIHMNRLYEFVKEYKQCSNCPGLENCPNDFKGHYTKLTVQSYNEYSQITDQKIACKKLKAYEAQENIRKKIRSFYIDERALNEGYSLNDIMQKDAQRLPAIIALTDYMEQTKREGLQKKGLYLSGTFGTGKTFLMCYMLNELAKSGHTGVIVYVPDFIEDLKEMMKDSVRLKNTIEMLKTTDLLVFDDLGAENINSWARDHVLGAILNYRMNRKPTFYTSNYDMNGLEKHFSFTSKDGEDELKAQRIMDRIEPFVQVIEVKGTNKRRTNEL